MLKQIRMSSGSFKNNAGIGIGINHKPVRFNMAFKPTTPISRKIMFFVFRRKNTTINQYHYNCVNFRHIFMAFFHEFIIFLELTSFFRLAHDSGFQVCQKFLGGCIGFCLFFAIHNIHRFFMGSGSHSIINCFFDFFDLTTRGGRFS